MLKVWAPLRMTQSESWRSILEVYTEFLQVIFTSPLTERQFQTCCAQASKSAGGQMEPILDVSSKFWVNGPEVGWNLALGINSQGHCCWSEGPDTGSSVDICHLQTLICCSANTQELLETWGWVRKGQQFSHVYRAHWSMPIYASQQF